MIREMHPHTRPQRARSPQAVPAEIRRLGYEPQDWPAARVGKGLALLIVMLIAIVMLAAPTVRWLGPDWRTSPARLAAERFASPAPPLQVTPEVERIALETAQRRRLERGPRPIAAAMREIARTGWQDGKAP